jgi:hypothetical protein
MVAGGSPVGTGGAGHRQYRRVQEWLRYPGAGVMLMVMSRFFIV